MVSSFILAFFDPVIFVPASLFGWFVSPKSRAIGLSFLWALGAAFLSYKMATSVGTVYDPLVIAAKIPPAIAITFFMHWVRKQLV